MAANFGLRSRRLPLESARTFRAWNNPDDVFALNWAFRKSGIEIPLQVVTDGKQALDYMSGSGEFADRVAHPLPALIFLDLKLPFFSGHEILEWIRQQPKFATLSVIVLSGSDEGRDREQAEANQANGYLVKPITPEALVHTLRSEPAFARLFDDCDGLRRALHDPVASLLWARKSSNPKSQRI